MSRLLTFFLCIGLAVSVSQHETMRGNPIRKVVTMLQDMQKSVEAEGEKEKKPF
jgi:5-enolpyruvylshikimate-3-phosphate synthase